MKLKKMSIKRLFSLLPVLCISLISVLACIVSSPNKAEIVKADFSVGYSSEYSFNISGEDVSNISGVPNNMDFTSFSNNVFKSELNYVRAVTNTGVSHYVQLNICYKLYTSVTSGIWFDTSMYNTSYQYVVSQGSGTNIQNLVAQRMNIADSSIAYNGGDMLNIQFGNVSGGLTNFKCYLARIVCGIVNYGHNVGSGYLTGTLLYDFIVYFNDVQINFTISNIHVIFLNNTNNQHIGDFVNKTFSSPILIFDLQDTPTDYDNGYEVGYEDGYNTGVENGYGVGWNGGYGAGYDDGYLQGYQQGNSDGATDYYNQGYADGYEVGHTEDATVSTIFSGILQVGMLPVNVFLAIFNFEILGINISAFVSAILTVCLTIIVIRTVMGGKDDK